MSTNQSMYTAFWLYKRKDSWRDLRGEHLDRAAREFACTLDDVNEEVTVRGTYTSLGLNASADLIVWASAPKLELLQELAIAIDRSEMAAYLDVTFNYFGVAGMSQYDPNHGPAFIQKLEPKRYLSVYPFMKTPDWYLLPYEERRRLMIEHGELGREFPTILTNTVNSFGLQDQEFIVALEDDDPEVLMKMVQKLRAAEVRKWTAVDTPIFLGDRKPIRNVMADLFAR